MVVVTRKMRQKSSQCCVFHYPYASSVVGTVDCNRIQPIIIANHNSSFHDKRMDEIGSTFWSLSEEDYLI